jgi:hypothetical protein
MTNVIIGQCYKGSKTKANAYKLTPTSQRLLSRIWYRIVARVEVINFGP